MTKSLTLDNGNFVFDGETIATHTFRDGRHTVTMNFSYEVRGELWWQPLVELVNGLKQFPEYEDVPTEVLLTLESDEHEVKTLTNVIRRLDEKTVKASGYKWRFHKNDADTFPSPLHGHDYERGLKIDALTGWIYDASTRNHCETLGARALEKLQGELRSSVDFADKLKALLPELPGENAEH